MPRRLLKWSALLSSLVCISGACKKPVDAPRSSPETPSTSSTAATASATTATTTSATAAVEGATETEDDDEARDHPIGLSPFFAVSEHHESKELMVNVQDCDLELAEELETKEELEFSNLYKIPIGHASLHESFREKERYTILFEDGSLSTFAVTRYDFEFAEVGDDSCHARLDGKARGKVPVIAFREDPDAKTQPTLRKAEAVTLDLEPGDAAYDALVAFLKRETKGYAKDFGSEPVEVIELRGKHGAETIRLRQIALKAAAEIEATIDEEEIDVPRVRSPSVWVDSEGKPLTLLVEDDHGIIHHHKHWVDHNADGKEMLLMTWDGLYSVGWVEYAIEFHPGQAGPENKVRAHVLFEDSGH